MLSRHIAISPLLGLLALCACSTESEGDQQNCPEGKCDALDDPEAEVPATVCDGRVLDESGRNLGTGKVAGRLGDPLAKMMQGLAEGEACPTSHADIVTRLKQVCEEPRTALVSETSQILGRAHRYRAVSVMDCPDGGQVFLSLFGINAEGSPADVRLPSAVEVIGLDPVDKTLNYYETNPQGGITFFGNSKDFVDAGVGEGEVRRCAACHTGGGLIQKELASPWLHWEPDFTSPGAAELLAAKRDLLGKPSNGLALEGVVREVNDLWNQARIDHVRAKLTGQATVAELLRPVFCTVEVNTDSMFDDAPRRAPISQAVIDQDFSNFTNISFDFARDYEPILKANGQSVRGLPGGIAPLETVGGLVTVARSGADISYERALMTANIIDREFVDDVRIIDFTRSVFSDDRCELLSFAPAIASDQLSPQAIRDGFIANLEAAAPASGTPAADLLANLKTEADQGTATAKVFEDACKARTDRARVTVDGADVEVPGFVRDYQAYISHNRKLAQGLPVFEFPSTMPTDDLPESPGLRLHPTTCQLTNEYVSVAGNVAPEPEPEPEPEDGGTGGGTDDGGSTDDGGGSDEGGAASPDSCASRCDTFEAGAACQCDQACTENNDCCPDRQAACGG